MKQQHIPVVQPVTVTVGSWHGLYRWQRPLYRPSQRPLYLSHFAVRVLPARQNAQLAIIRLEVI